jgi:hypothetical protein
VRDLGRGGDPTVPDPATQLSLDKAKTKAEASIDKVCVTVPGNPPCYVAFTNGEQWTDTVSAVLVGGSPATYCGSPSGAFLN